MAEVVRRSDVLDSARASSPWLGLRSARLAPLLLFAQPRITTPACFARWAFSLSRLASRFHASANPSPPAKADTSQEAFVFDRIENLVRFEDDGTGIRDTTAVIRIQSQAGVQEFGQLIFDYSQDTEKLEIQYVRVRKPDGQVIETPLSGAQDFAPEILKEAPMYSDYRQRHVSVSSLQPGDVLEYRTIVHVTTALASHQFWYDYSFPKEVAIHENRLEINIPKAREIKLKSPKTPIRNPGARRPPHLHVGGQGLHS